MLRSIGFYLLTAYDPDALKLQLEFCCAVYNEAIYLSIHYYCAVLPPPTPAIEATLTIAPLLRSNMCLPTACDIKKVPVILASITCRQRSRGILSAGAPHVKPALLTSTSILPHFSSTCCTVCSTEAVS